MESEKGDKRKIPFKGYCKRHISFSSASLYAQRYVKSLLPKVSCITTTSKAIKTNNLNLDLNSMQIIKQSVGIDVSKDTLEICIGSLITTLEHQILYTGQVSNTESGIEQLIGFLRRYCSADSAVHCIMEATGVYHELVAHRLHECETQVYIILPTKAKAFVKSINQRAKTDRVDARLLCQLGLERSLQPWKPADPLWQQVRGLTREREALVNERSRLKNKKHALTTAFIPSTTTLVRLKERITMINAHIKAIEQELRTLFASQQTLQAKVDNICQIKGISLLTVATVLGETNGFNLIRNQRQLVAYAGMDVKIHQSGSVQKKGRLSKKGNVHIRQALYMPALNAAHKNLALSAHYKQLNERQQAKKQGVIAVARKLLILIYSLWKNEETYDPHKNLPIGLTLSTV
ncbi:MAG: IS110 family transposase [Balneola sp.]